MDWMALVYLLVALLLVLLNGFFVLAEFALVTVRATRIDELALQGDARAETARGMVGHLDNYLSATQLGITVASLGLGWVGEPAFAHLVGAVVGLPGWWSPQTSHALSAVVAFLIITFLHILVGELAPKSLAIRRPEQSALFIARPMRFAFRLFYLPMLVLNGASNWILRRMRLEAEHHDVAHTEHELRTLLSQAEESGRVSLNRLLILENIFDLGRQTVRDAMIVWSHVRCLASTWSKSEIMQFVSEHRHSRWPVMDAAQKPVGYLLMKDLVLLAPDDGNWQRLLRPLRVVEADDSLERTMHQLQTEGANMAVVMESGRPVGLITLEDILEEIVGRIEDEYPRLPRYFLKDSLLAGGVVLDLVAATAEEAIRALAAALPRERLPQDADVFRLALERERQVTSDIGHGVAVPHARCPGLLQPLLVFGRSEEGIAFDPQSAELVHLVFLIVTPAERPNLQVFFLAQIASAARSEFIRERLMRAEDRETVIEILAAADPAVTG
jgi:CBS domain containing-hemolysin-like protein